MKKKAVIAMAVVIVVLTAGVIISRGKMPYKDLKASDIVSVLYDCLDECGKRLALILLESRNTII